MFPKDIPIRIKGIPAIAKVFKCEFHKGDSNAMNPDDYYDTWDLDCHILDRKGYRADWLEEKLVMDDDLRNEVEKNIIEEIEIERKGL